MSDRVPGITAPDWEAWAHAWSSAAAGTTLEELRSLARRQRRRQLLTVAGELVVALAFVALTAFVLSRPVEPWHLAWLVTLWAFTALAFAFAWWNRRATWRSAAATVEDHLRLCRLRIERQLRSLRFAWWLLAAEIVAVVGQLAWFDRLVPAALGGLLGATAAVAGWVLSSRRRLRRELAGIAGFERTAGNADGPLPSPP